jgi:uncharacterized membrane protein YfcA
MNWALVGALVLGIFVGIVAGLVGVGGGVVLIPALVYIFHMNQHEAQGTSLGMLLFPTGLLAFWEYYKAGKVDFRLAIFIAIGVFIGGYFGGFWAQKISNVALKKGFAVVLAVTAIKLFFEKS